MLKIKPFVFTTLIVLFFAGITVFFTHPVLKESAKGIPYTKTPMQGWENVEMYQGDHIQLYYHYWMAYDYLFTGGNFWQNPYEFSYSDIKVFTSRRVFLCVLYVLFALIGGPLWAYNMLTLSAVFLAGLCTFYFVKYLLKSTMAGLIAGVMFASFPYGLGQLFGGHPNGFLLWMIPLIFLWSHRLLEEGKMRYALYLLPLIATFAYIEYHLLYYTFLLYPPYWAGVIAQKIIRSKTSVFTTLKKMLPALLALGFVCAVGAAILFYIKHVEIGTSTEKAGRTIQEVAIYSPHHSNFWRKINPDLERNIYLGYISFALSLAGLFVLCVKMFASHAKPARLKTFFLSDMAFIYFAGLFGVATVLCLGLSVRIPLYKLLYYTVPYFNYSRNPSRIFVYAMLAMGVLSGYVFITLRAWFDRHAPKLKKITGPVLCAGIIAVNVIDFAPELPVGISLVDPDNTIYKYVKENINEGEKTFMVPLWPGDSAWSSIYMYYMTLTRVKAINGYYPLVPERYITEVFNRLFSVNVGELSTQQVKILKDQNVRFVIVHQDTFPKKVSHYPSFDTVERLKNNPALTYLATDRTMHLFELKHNPDLKPVTVVPACGMYYEECHLATKSAVVEDSTASNKRALEFDKPGKMDQPLIWGTKQILPAGHYKVTYRVKSESADNTFKLAVFDNTVAKEFTQIASKKVSDNAPTDWTYITLDVVSNTPFQPDYRIYKTGTQKLWLDNIYITRTGYEGELEFLEAEDTFTAVNTSIVTDPEASGTLAAVVNPDFVHKTRFEAVYGPYRRFAKGNYVLNVRYKCSKAAGPDPVMMEVTCDWGREKLATKPVEANTGEKYKTLKVPFTLERDRVLEFRAIYLKPCLFAIDCFEITKANTQNQTAPQHNNQ